MVYRRRVHGILSLRSRYTVILFMIYREKYTVIHIRQLLKIPRSKKCYYEIKELLRALRFFVESFYFFFNRIARYAQSKESRNLLKKIS